MGACNAISKPDTDANFLNALCNFEAGMQVGLQNSEPFVSAGAHLDLAVNADNDDVCISGRLRNSDIVSLRVMVGMALDTEPPNVLRQMLQEAKLALNDPVVATSAESHRNSTELFVQLRCLQALETGIEMAEAGGAVSNPGGVSRQFATAQFTAAGLAAGRFQDCAPWLRLVRTAPGEVRPHGSGLWAALSSSQQAGAEAAEFRAGGAAAQ